MMPEWTTKRIANMEKIYVAFADSPFFTVHRPSDDYIHAAYKCYVQVNREVLPKEWSRDRIINELNALNVPCFSGSCSEVYLEHAFDDTPWRPLQRLPNAQKLGETSLMFLHHRLLNDPTVAQ